MIGRHRQGFDKLRKLREEVKKNEKI